MIMYAVSSGEYSYYRVHCLFADRELAEAHAAARNADDDHDEAFIEEFTVVDRLPEKVTWFFTQHRLHEDGSWPPKLYDPVERNDWEYEVPSGLSARPNIALTHWQESTYDGFTSGSSEEGPKHVVYGLSIQGTDSGNVGKATSEVVAQWRAQGYRLHNARPA